MTSRWLMLALATLALLQVQAATFFTNPVDFSSATSGLIVSTVDFESAPAGTTIPTGSSVGGITFTYSIFGLNMMFANDALTTSGTRYLGLEGSGTFNQFLAGDTFTMSFSPSRALGLFFITAPPDEVGAGDIHLVTPLGTVVNAATPLTVLGDGGLVYFLGVVAGPGDPSFGTAEIDFGAGGKGAFFFSVDDITRGSEIPEPSAGLLVLGALAALHFRRSRGLAGT